jgi:hypothetical protein
MSQNNNNNNNNGNNDANKPKPSGKGKEREENTSAQTGAQGWGETAEPDWTPGPYIREPTNVGPPKKYKRKRSGRTRAQKKKLNDEAEKAINDDMSDDSITRDLAGEAPAHADDLRYILRLSEADESEAQETIPGNDDVTMEAPPSQRSESAERHLKPPSRAEPSSSASSRTNKRPREKSPEQIRPQQRPRHENPRPPKAVHESESFRVPVWVTRGKTRGDPTRFDP